MEAIIRAITASFTRLVIRQGDQSKTNQDGPISETLLYLSLGALIGVLYSLGTEKYIRAMQHRHIFIRNAMLWLSAITWLILAIAMIWVASKVYIQSQGGLEGFDRILGILIPFVVRADLVLDWAKRVAWALLNMSNWTQGSVQLRRLITRAHNMTQILEIDEEVEKIARKQISRVHDLIVSENIVWTEDADALVKTTEVLLHFQKLSRVALYAIGGLVGAIPGAIIWIFYGFVQAIISFKERRRMVVGVMYLISIVFAPLGAVIAILSSAGLLCGVVTLSVLGTTIQYFVYWSTRTVYAMVRIAVSQAWAGFPDLTRPDSMPNLETTSRVLNTGLYAVRAIRHPEEAGAAIARMGCCLPTELEFALASWDGRHYLSRSEKIDQSQSWYSFNYFVKSKDGNENHQPNSLSNDTSTNYKKKGINANSRTSSGATLDVTDEYDLGAFGTVDSAKIEGEESYSNQNHNRRNEVELVLLGRLGLDLSIKSARNRRLSTYYGLAMLVNMQVESGGNAWKLQIISDADDDEFDRRIESFQSIVATEARISLYELAGRLRTLSKYRVIPCADPINRMVPVQQWLKTILLLFLETPADTDGDSQLQLSIA